MPTNKKHYCIALLTLVIAISRWPGLLPSNFSAVYALVFCAATLFPAGLTWRVPLCMLGVTDLALLSFYNTPEMPMFTRTSLIYLSGNYLGYLALFLLGSAFRQHRSLPSLLGGSLLGSIIFYLVTNTFSWMTNPFRNPEYTRSLAGWLIALTKGTGGYPETWEFFRNTLLSGGLFTGLFASAWKIAVAESPQEKGETDASTPEREPEESGVS